MAAARRPPLPEPAKGPVAASDRDGALFALGGVIRHSLSTERIPTLEAVVDRLAGLRRLIALGYGVELKDPKGPFSSKNGGAEIKNDGS